MNVYELRYMQTSVFMKFIHEVLRRVTEVFDLTFKISRHNLAVFFFFLNFNNLSSVDKITFFFPLTFIQNLSLCFPSLYYRSAA